jgi:hypothetical protein
MKKINNEKIQHLSFVELYNIFNFLKYELDVCDENEKEIIRGRIKATEEELKRIINNLF